MLLRIFKTLNTRKLEAKNTKSKGNTKIETMSKDRDNEQNNRENEQIIEKMNKIIEKMDKNKQ